MNFFAADISDAVLAAIVAAIISGTAAIWASYRFVLNKLLSAGDDFKNKCQELEKEIDQLKASIQQCTAIDCIFRGHVGPAAAHSLPAPPIAPLPRYMRNNWKPTPPQPT